MKTHGYANIRDKNTTKKNEVEKDEEEEEKNKTKVTASGITVVCAGNLANGSM